MASLGKINSLYILRKTTSGVLLESGDGQEIFLPKKYAPKTIVTGDVIDVFLYTDSKGRIAATTLKPTILLHQFAVLEVKKITQMGAFLDWGLEKDLILPFSEQMGRVEKGDQVTVHLCRDERTDRLFASAKIHNYVEINPTVSQGDEVDLLVDRQSELGWQVVINNRHLGLIFSNKLFRHLHQGERTKGFIDNIREDGKIDVSLQRQGYAQVADSQSVLLEKLKERDGVLHLTDKSDAELIYRELGMSKKIFKKCVGALYKQRKIKIESDCIVLVK